MTEETVAGKADKFTEMGVPEVYAREAYRRDWHPDLPSDFSLMLIHGNVGSGKTIIATTLLAEIAAAEHLETKPTKVTDYSPHTGGRTRTQYGHAQWIDYTEWISELRPRDVHPEDVWRDQERRDRARDKATKAEVLVLDDLGATRLTPFALEEVAGLLRYRESRHLRTIVTTNLRPSDISALDPRLGSRLTGGVVVKREGEDYRVKNAVKIGY